MGTTKDYYGVLGVARDATIAEIKRAYRAIAMTCHPDHAGDSAEAVSRYREASEAYKTLTDSDARRKYDRGFDPVVSIRDLFGRHPVGRHVMDVMLPRAPAEPQPGVDLLLVREVPARVLEEGGIVAIAIGGREVALQVPQGARDTPWCMLAGLGTTGKNEGKNGDLFVLLLEAEEGVP